MDDPELLQRYRRGDSGAFARLLTRHETGLLRYATSLTGDANLAEDVVQETFLALVRHVRRRTELDRPSSWLYHVARNRSRDILKREIRMKTRHRAMAVTEEEPARAADLELEERDCALARELQRLGSETREVLALKIQAQKSYREIARITGFSLGKISELAHQGLRQLSRGLRAAGVV